MEQWIVILSCSVLFLLILIVHAHYQIHIERKLFTIRISSPWRNVLATLFYGLIGALLASLLIALLGLQLTLQAVLGVSVASLFLALINIRYLSFFYAGSIISLLAIVTQQGLIDWDNFGFFWLQQYFTQIDISSLLALAGILYVIEALLLSLKGKYGQIPAVYFGQRGKLVGGFMLQRLWLLPMIVFAPSSIGWDFSFMPAWWPFFGDFSGGESAQDYSLFFLPIMLGFTSIVIGRQPRELMRTSSRWLLLVGIVIIGLSYVSQFNMWVMLITAIVTLAAHEVLILTLQAKEKKAKPYFSHSKDGLAILAILQGSPAAEMGVLPGERVARVNGIEVKHTKELYAALQQNAAYCKLEVVNLAGNVKFLERSLYSGEHYLLGIILAPDENTRVYIKSSYTNLLSVLLQKIKLGKKQENE